MKQLLLIALFLLVTFQSFASPTLIELTLEEKLERAKYIYVAEVVGVVSGTDEPISSQVQQYLQIRVVTSLNGENINTSPKVVSFNGIAGSQLGIECVGGTYLFMLRDHKTLGSELKTGFLESVNSRFSIYEIENDKVLEFEQSDITINEVMSIIRQIADSRK